MRFVDVNVLVYAHRSDVPRHAEYRDWLAAARLGPEPLAVTDQVLASFLRVVTHPRVFREPTPLSDAVGFARAIKASPAYLPPAPVERTWEVLIELLERIDARGNDVPDAYLAAQAMASGAELVTADRGFARFPGLQWRHPLDV